MVKLRTISKHTCWPVGCAVLAQIRARLARGLRRELARGNLLDVALRSFGCILGVCHSRCLAGWILRFKECRKQIIDDELKKERGKADAILAGESRKSAPRHWLSNDITCAGPRVVTGSLPPFRITTPHYLGTRTRAYVCVHGTYPGTYCSVRLVHDVDPSSYAANGKGTK